jgi:murein DD-endopeptidase MepM/ murein hydrolase activator NlpD
MNRRKELPASSWGMTWLAQLVAEFFNRHLTVVACSVALVGLALVLLGPVRTQLSSSRTSPSGTGTIAEAAGAVILPAGGEAGSIPGELVDRSLVPYTTIPNRPRDEVVTYTVQRGDTLMGIADAFQIDRNSVFWANMDTLRGDVHLLLPGMDLYILPTDGVLHKSDGQHTLQWIADKYEVDVEAIIDSEFNELEGATADTVPPWGMRIVVPGGTGEFPDWRAPIVETVDQATGAVSRAFMPNMAGSCAPGIVGAGGTGAWVPPLAAYSFTQSFYPGHSGVDLAAPIGTSVTAADTGVVVFSGWVDQSWGYGIVVVLDHGNGWTTYYAHLSTNGVRCGQVVQRGGYIGQVGSTGNSSGPHLHFEMRWNHVPDNPAYYIGF